jgi:nitrate reductase delta subunit
MKNYRALAALLSYPEPALLEALPEIARFVPREVLPLVAELGGQDLLASQERYVALFDRSRALSLHLFEHVHGESRERGQAMVDLQGMYELHGMRIVEHELPDYLPAFLEFLSLLSGEEAAELLKDTAAILRAVGERLAERGSRYAAVFGALLEMCGEPALKKRVAPEAKPVREDLLALDRAWMDPEVTFGGPQPIRLYRKDELPT